MGKRVLDLAILALALVLAGGCASTEEVVVRERQVLAFPPAPAEPRFYFEGFIFSTAAVHEYNETDVLRQLITGETGVSGETFAKPFSVAVHKGRVFISDTVRSVVTVLDFPNRKSFKIGLSGDGTLGKPLGLDTDDAGNLYVADISFNRIVVYNRDGVFLRALGGRELLDRVSGVAVLPDGSKVFAVDTGGVSSTNHRVRVFDGNTGKHLYDIGSRGNGDGQFNLPREAAIGPDNRLYVVDGGNFRVQVFEEDGTFVTKFGSIGRRPGQFARPKGIAVDKESNVYVSDTAFGNIQIFDAEGNLLMWLGARGNDNVPASYMLPAGLEVDEDGRVYFVDQFFRRLDIYRPAGLDEGAGYLRQKNDSAARPK